MRFRFISVRSVLFTGHFLAEIASTEAAEKAGKGQPTNPIAPAVSTGTGLLLEPALTLPEFTREKFAAAMATVGPEKIQRPWTHPVVTLPPHPRTDVKGLTEAEVKAYMTENGVHAALRNRGSRAGRGGAVEGVQRGGFCGVCGRVGADINSLAGHIIC